MTGFPQPLLGVLAFGTTHHAYLELDRHPQLPPRGLVAAVRVVENAVLTGAGVHTLLRRRPRPTRSECSPHR
jgi:hypothetical protein